MTAILNCVPHNCRHFSLARRFIVRQLLVSVLAISLSGAPVLAQSLQGGASPATATPLQESARVEASKFAAALSAQSDDYRPGGMKPGYFWGGIGLMIAGAAWMTAAALVSTTCASIAGFDDVDCGGVSKGSIVAGAGLLAAGGVVFMMGKKEARANPQISWTPHGVAVRTQFTF
jgi:hypothetical protein